jgi:predicted transglutaminase-like cysteine proteinase
MDRLNEIAEKCLQSILSMDGQLPLFHGAALQAIKAAMVQYNQEQPSSVPVVPIIGNAWKELQFKVFMDRYGKKVGRAATLKKWMKLTKPEIERVTIQATSTDVS